MSATPANANEVSFESLTSSGLLAKHTANIARLAQNFGISIGDQEVKDSKPKINEEEFKSKLLKMAESVTEN